MIIINNIVMGPNTSILVVRLGVVSEHPDINMSKNTNVETSKTLLNGLFIGETFFRLYFLYITALKKNLQPIFRQKINYRGIFECFTTLFGQRGVEEKSNLSSIPAYIFVYFTIKEMSFIRPTLFQPLSCMIFACAIK